jgi:hypothetical protein
MKKSILTILLFCSSVFLFAQDLITRTNGEKINCTVTGNDSVNIYFNMDRNGQMISTSLAKNLVRDIQFNAVKKPYFQDKVEGNKVPILEPLPKFALGLGTGINSFTGLIGISGNLKIADHFSLRAAMGLGGWGRKFSGGVSYDLHPWGGWSFGLGYSYCPGISGMKLSITDAYGNTQNITLDYLKASTVNLTTLYYFKIGKKSTIYLEGGLALQMETNPWRVTDGSTLTDEGKALLGILQPGGIVVLVGFGFTFGIGE